MILHRPFADPIGTFEPRLDEGRYLLRTGGGVYFVLTDDLIVRTKHVKSFKTQFPGLLMLNQPDDLRDGYHDDSASLDIKKDASEIFSLEATGDGAPSPDSPDGLTYIPQERSQIGEYHSVEDPEYNEEHDNEDKVNASHEDEFIDTSTTDMDSRSYNLGERWNINYSGTAHHGIVTDTDEPKSCAAVKYAIVKSA